jgi:hypothetical protein
MEVKYLLKKGRETWGEDFKMNLSQIVPAMGKVFGDICKWTRDYREDGLSEAEQELKKELGNIIFSTIRWCDDLGYDPEECVKLAIECQEKFPKSKEYNTKKIET